MIGKRFLDTFMETKRLVSLVAWRAMAPLGLGRAQVALLIELGRVMARPPRSRLRARP